MKKMMVTLGMVAVMLIGVAYAFPQGPGSGSGPGPGPGWEHHRDAGEFGGILHLTPEQKIRLDELRNRFTQENAQLIGGMVTKRIELQSLWSDPKADPSAIAKKEGELRDLRNQLGDKAIQMKLEARKVLTPEQSAQWKPGMGLGPGGGPGRQGCGRGFGRGCRDGH